MPEPLTFSMHLIESALPPPHLQTTQILPACQIQPPGGWEGVQHAIRKAAISPLALSDCQQSSNAVDAEMSLQFRAAALIAALGIVKRVATDSDESAGIPEAIYPAQQLLQKLHGVQGLPKVYTTSLYQQIEV